MCRFGSGADDGMRTADGGRRLLYCFCCVVGWLLLHNPVGTCRVINHRTLAAEASKSLPVLGVQMQPRSLPFLPQTSSFPALLCCR